MTALTMRPAVASEAGVRQNNEDAAFASARLAAVADGVGGAVAGEVASELAINKLIGLDKRRLAEPLPRELEAVVDDANAVIDFAISYDPVLAGMGTTLTAVALSNEGEYVVANVGDSRTYLLRGGRLHRLTRDDSFVQDLIDRGALSEDEARSHPRRSIVLDVLNGDERPASRLRTVRARAGDRLLLCSDGVTDYLADAALAAMLEPGVDARVAARRILAEALAAGSRDNVTAVVADVELDPDAGDRWLAVQAFSDRPR
jgi:serine/threonine protein phosphatase PrpC